MTRRKRALENLDQDIRDHLERETRENIERGMDTEEARQAALRKFGNVTRIAEETREVWTVVWVEQLIQDLSVRTGIGKRVYPHPHRHSYATSALNRGMNPIMLADILGHTSLAMIQNVHSQAAHR